MFVFSLSSLLHTFNGGNYIPYGFLEFRNYWGNSPWEWKGSIMKNKRRGETGKGEGERETTNFKFSIYQ